MTFGNMNGFLIDFSGPAGDLAFGGSDNFYDPCSPRVTVGVGTKLPVVVRASGSVAVRQGITVDNKPVEVEVGVIEVTAQNISVAVSQPGGASNPIRLEQPETVNQPQTIGVVVADKAAAAEFARGWQRAGVLLLTPKVTDSAEAAVTLQNEAGNVVKELGKQIAVEVDAARATEMVLNSTDDVTRQMLGNQLKYRLGSANLQSVLQKAGVGLDDVNNIRNGIYAADASVLDSALLKVADKIPNIVRELQTQAANIAVRVCA